MVGRRILVTGTSGFIGSHLAEELSIDPLNKVFCVDKKTLKNTYFSIKQIKYKCIFKNIDLKQKIKVFSLIKKGKFAYIFHLAADAIVDEAYKFPHETINNNILSTLNILEAVRRFSSNTKIVIASSDKAYGKLKRKYKESDELRGDHPYEISKSCCEFITQAYIKTYKVNAVITRCGNVYGEGDLHFNRLIPEIVKSVLKNEKLIIRSDGKFKRDYIYVKDVVSAYIAIMKKFDKVKGEALNVSSNENYSVLEVVKRVEKFLKKRISYEIVNKQKNEIPNQSLNSNKIKSLINWKSKYELQKVIPGIFDFYSNYVFSKNKS